MEQVSFLSRIHPEAAKRTVGVLEAQQDPVLYRLLDVNEYNLSGNKSSFDGLDI